jgi:1-acyl-sn-glycerol-3-phosphate acyltransferase
MSTPPSEARTAPAPSGSQLRSVVRGAAMLGFTAGITHAGLLRFQFCSEQERPTVAARWVGRWAGGLLRVFGVEQHWASALPAATDRARLVVANHRSPLDILLMLQHFGGSVLARHDLERWPVMGRAARTGGTIFVDRQDAKSGVRAIREIRKRLQAHQTVVVFPEGTTHAGDLVHAFLGGAFSAVSSLPAELVPVGIAYDPGAEFVGESFAAHLVRVAQRPRTRVALCVGDSLPASRDREQMARDLRDAVQALVTRARAQLT